MRTIIPFLAIAVAALPASASQSPVGMYTVQDPTLTNGIAVYRLAGRGPADYWCSAGDYAYRRLGVGAGGVLVLERPLGAPGGPSRRQSVGFSVSTTAAPTSDAFSSVDQVGQASTVTAARTLCKAREQIFQRGGGD